MFKIEELIEWLLEKPELLERSPEYVLAKYMEEVFLRANGIHGLQNDAYHQITKSARM